MKKIGEASGEGKTDNKKIEDILFKDIEFINESSVYLLSFTIGNFEANIYEDYEFELASKTSLKKAYKEIEKIMSFIAIEGTSDEKLQKLENLGIENETYNNKKELLLKLE